MTVYVLPRWSKTDLPAFDVTSRGRVWQLSPMKLGPVDLYDGYRSLNVENAWQYSKVYPQHELHGEPTQFYWDWAVDGWSKKWADRYPMGKGARPAYSLWDGEKLGYIEARKRIYIPLYRKAAENSMAFHSLRQRAQGADIALLDFDAYDHRALGYSWEDVVNDPSRKMGHGFVLAMMIEGYKP